MYPYVTDEPSELEEMKDIPADELSELQDMKDISADELIELAGMEDIPAEKEGGKLKGVKEVLKRSNSSHREETCYIEALFYF